MNRHRELRRQIFVDPKVQGALLRRVVFYWCMCLLSGVAMLLCWRMATGPAKPLGVHFLELWYSCAPLLIPMLLLLPLVLIDMVRLSNRFVGPLVRFRRAMRQWSRGEIVRPLAFRQGDFWADLATEFNQAVARCGINDPKPVAEGGSHNLVESSLN